MSRLFLIIPLLLLAACSGNRQAAALLDRIDSLTYEQPDSALRLLQQHEAEAATWSRSLQMRHALLTARAQNKAFVDFTTDSVLLEVTDYYDRHGTPNQQLEAHYLLGCTYRDLGEAPRAIECFLDATAKADTTVKDCDYRTLGRTYSQMAYMYHSQLLLKNEIEARKQAFHFSCATGDTLTGMKEMKLMATTYILQNKLDSAEYFTHLVIHYFHDKNRIQDELQSSSILMYIYERQTSRMYELDSLISRYDNECSLFDSLHNLPPSKRQYFYHKGQYFEKMHQLDSAEYYYRKIFHPNMSFAEKDPMYRGLLSVFQKKRQPDSIAKYATLFAEVNDSSIELKDREITAQMAASYNYNRYQRQALENAEKAHAANLRFVFISFLLLALLAGLLLYMRKSRKRHEEQMARYRASISERNRLKQELNSLRDKNYDAVIVQKEEEIARLTQDIEQQSGLFRQIAVSNRLSDFEASDIVKTFNSKWTFVKGQAVPTSDDWRALVSQFRQDMPSAYATMTCLSPLQLEVCILLLLGFEEGEIAYIRQSKPQVINTAKVRANQKLFLSGDAASLKRNLMGMIAS